MIKKMRGQLHPSVKLEVGYKGVVKDGSNVMFIWKMNAAARSRAFIPDMQDRDLCYNADKKISHAASEAKLILEEFQNEFGENTGIGLYNKLYKLIGERDKNCLPFVNMCLRTWLVRLCKDPDLYVDKSEFKFDRWVTKMTQPVTHQHGEKRSYELMVAVFGTSETEKQTSNAGQSPRTSAAKANERISKLQKIGEEVKKKLLVSHKLRARKSSTTVANKEVMAAVEQSKECDLNHHVSRKCREASQNMEDLLFSAGGAERIVTTLR